MAVPPTPNCGVGLGRAGLVGWPLPPALSSGALVEMHSRPPHYWRLLREMEVLVLTHPPSGYPEGRFRDGHQELSLHRLSPWDCEEGVDEDEGEEGPGWAEEAEGAP